MKPKSIWTIGTAIKRSPLLAFSLTLLLLIVALSTTLSLLLERQVRSSIVDARVNLYPQILSQVLEMHPSVFSFVNAKEMQPDADARAYFHEIREITGAERLKLWNREYEIIWSDAHDAIGRAFPDNELLRAALDGEIVYEIEEVDQEENITEEGFGKALEIYVPVRTGGETVGAIELYNRSESLFARIEDARHAIWLSVGLGGAGLYLRARLSG